MKFNDFINEGTKWINKISKLKPSDFKRTKSAVQSYGGEVSFDTAGKDISSSYYGDRAVIYYIEQFDIYVCTEVTAKTVEFMIYDNDFKLDSVETITLKSFIKKFSQMIPGLQMPWKVRIKGGFELVSKLDKLIRDKNDIVIFLFKNGAEHKVSRYSDDKLEYKNTILSEIDRIAEMDKTIKNKALKMLKEIYPEFFEIDFKLDNELLIIFDKFSTDKIYQKFIKGIDNNSRTGWGITIDEKSIQVHGMIGNTSDGFRIKAFKYKDFGDTPKSEADLKKFMKKSGAIEYIVDLGARIFGEMESYRNYMKSGGSLD
jgi:hypothetical protein